LAFGNPAVPEHDIWAQDTAEIGYATNGRAVMQVALHGNRGRELDRLFAAAFLGQDAGVYQAGSYRGESAEWIDWYGNLEVSPPFEVGDPSYPKGRIYAGTQGVRAMHPEVVAFLEAQGEQGPVLWLDTSWLVIGHVDETVSWVPSRVGSPYRMLLPSPRLALEILRKAEQDAPGRVLNRGTSRADSRKGDFVEVPVAKALSSASLIKAQDFVQEKIDGVRRTLQAELGIADADIVEIPVLFGTMPGRFMGRYDALTTNMVNSLLVGDTLIVPDPHGPLVNGNDVLLQAVRDRLEPLGCKVAAIDDFYPYHRYGGETHCGTNATRRPPATR
jgi:protein-arginine deiminase